MMILLVIILILLFILVNVAEKKYKELKLSEFYLSVGKAIVYLALTVYLVINQESIFFDIYPLAAIIISITGLEFISNYVKAKNALDERKNHEKSKRIIAG